MLNIIMELKRALRPIVYTGTSNLIQTNLIHIKFVS